MFRKIILFLTPLLILTIVFLLVVLLVNREGGRGALQVTSVPNSQVFLNGKHVGKTPFCLCELPQLLKTGDYSIKLIPTETGFREFEQKITIYPGVLTVVDRTFDKQISKSSGSIITLSPTEKTKSELLIISFPGKAQVVLDSNQEGITPLFTQDITPSDHEIKILKDGYKEKIIKVKATLGKRLEITVTLGVKANDALQEKNSSSSASLSSKVIILDTPTGFLRVRERDSLNSPQIATVNPGDRFDLVSEKSEWFEIRLLDGKTGWISSTYARKE